MSLHALSDGKLIKNFPLEMGTVSSYSGKRYQTEMFYGFVSFLTPGIFYRCDLTKDDLVPEVRPTLMWYSELTLIRPPLGPGEVV